VTPALPRLSVGLVLLVVAVSTGCSTQRHGSDITIVVSAPTSTAPWVATAEVRGAQLAADQLNAAGGVDVGGTRRSVSVDVRDNAGSAREVVADAQYAVSHDAAAMVIDGVGAAAVAQVTDPADLPVFVVFEGGADVVDPAQRPTLFRLAPADAAMSMRLADYLAASHPLIGLLTDDSEFGQAGRGALRPSFARDRTPVVADQVVAATAADVTPAVRALRRAGATTVVVWAGAPVVAATVVAVRSDGWNVPVWAGPSAEDPLVRQRVAAHPDWLDGIGFVSFRMTAEVGAPPFEHYRAAYEKKYGADKVGVEQAGQAVVQPPDWSMFSYDSVRLVAAAIAKAGGTGAPLLHTLEGHVVITGANGDERGYLATNREGVSPDDMYLAQFHGFVFAPVKNDLLSEHLPAVPQTER
jgi:ABC-type branched-subunit amino acid transport system substrate-binding protein